MRLQESGLLQLVQVATFNLSNIYRLVDVAPECANLATLYLPPVREWLTKHIEHDAFRWSGLNKTGFEVWVRLKSRDRVTTKDLEAETGRCRTTIAKKLEIMFRLGMAEPLGNGIWRAVPNVDLGAIAKELGTVGKGEAQRQMHRRQREARNRALERGWIYE
jgi:hypothetical protein